MAKGIPINGKKFAEFRNEKLLSQDAMARITGMTKGGIARIEGLISTSMHASSILKVATATSTDTAELLKRIGRPAEMRIAAKKKRGGPK